MTPERKDIPVAELSLDPFNPRLPEQLQGADQGALLVYLREEAVLDELIGSFVDNGFFEHEPLIGYQDENLGTVVLEGNRRLASLKILLEEPVALAEELRPTLDQPLDTARRNELLVVPIYLVPERNDVHKYLGYRHIGGTKTWSAESKARYLMQETDRAASADPTSPFLEVARRVGSNTQGVRNAYTALSTLRFARDEFGLDVTYVVDHRFGVWSRCMTAGDIRTYIELGSGTTYQDVTENIKNMDREKLGEVISDLSSNGSRPLLNDSRDVTTYGRILVNDVARSALRKFQDLEIARQIVDMADLPSRINDIRDRTEVVRSEASSATHSVHLEEATNGLFASARSLHATVRALREEEDSE